MGAEDQLTIFDFMEDGEKHKPIKSTDWKWTFADYPKEKNGIKVFSCFACGGGSTMGYKLAGCEVLGCCEIDQQMNDLYVANHHPKYNFLMDIRDFNKLPDSEIPAELFDIDVLDGSPPCTTFSMAGDREDSWGQEREFREGQVKQTLDDLSFVFIDTVKKLHPKVVVMENVEGLTIGAAWQYVQKIYIKLTDAGYKVNHWLLKGEQMGVPQTRHRVFFVAIRNDIGVDPKDLDMSFNYLPVTFGEIKSPQGQPFSERGKAGKFYQLLLETQDGDKSLCDIIKRKGGKNTAFQQVIIRDTDVCPTIRASRAFDGYRYPELTKTTSQDVINSQTFPQDYYFGENAGKTIITYVCGMSVPPIMMKRIAQRLIDQGVFSYKEAENGKAHIR